MIIVLYVVNVGINEISSKTLRNNSISFAKVAKLAGSFLAIFSSKCIVVYVVYASNVE